MTQEEKQLLLKDICARLSYGVKIATSLYQYGDVSTIKGIVGEKCYFNDNPRYDGDCPIEEVKPYLRPMSSMTEEEENEFDEIIGYNGEKDGWTTAENIHTRWGIYLPGIAELIDWLNEHHFDYRNLIEKGLALEAPEYMYK